MELISYLEQSKGTKRKNPYHILVYYKFKRMLLGWLTQHGSGVKLEPSVCQWVYHCSSGSLDVVSWPARARSEGMPQSGLPVSALHWAQMTWNLYSLDWACRVSPWPGHTLSLAWNAQLEQIYTHNTESSLAKEKVSSFLLLQENIEWYTVQVTHQVVWLHRV